MASRKLEDLQPETRERVDGLLRAAQAAHFDVLIYCTLRPLAEQARLFRQGRSFSEIQAKANELERVWHRPDLAELLIGVGPQHGKTIVTWAGPGQSLHNYGCAIDGVPLVDGKPVWGTRRDEDAALWQRYGQLGKDQGLEWAGDWSPAKREFPHLQESGLDWRDLIRSAP